VLRYARERPSAASNAWREVGDTCSYTRAADAQSFSSSYDWPESTRHLSFMPGHFAAIVSSSTAATMWSPICSAAIARSQRGAGSSSPCIRARTSAHFRASNAAFACARLPVAK
jgi:hypothetical protein